MRDQNRSEFNVARYWAPVAAVFFAFAVTAFFAAPSKVSAHDHAPAAAPHIDEKNKHDHAQGHENNEDRGGESEHEHEESSDVELSEAQQKFAGIRVVALQPEVVHYSLVAPGELQSNGYTSYEISARVPSVVLQRYVMLGESVKEGQALLSLFSEEVAEAQSAYRIAFHEWQRVKALGRSAVGDSRYFNAQAGFEAAAGKLRVFGLSDPDMRALEGDEKIRAGEYVLRASKEGLILKDDFHQGQRVEAGQSLLSLVDESVLWVDARLPPGKVLALTEATQATIVLEGTSFPAQLTQASHRIDPRTRTRAVRLSVENPDHKLHAGQFVEVHFICSTEVPVLSLPESAVLRGADGDWQVFIEEAPGRYVPKEVEVQQALDNRLVISGIDAGTRVVSAGAFFVQSEFAKSGFEVHNH
ncbi:Hypothetical protein HDN1F_23900 [gamma proteobacterium HdN1]|nr:Hypothetical protein HDN1F_23900 [gamma proteobacterium HdN1]